MQMKNLVAASALTVLLVGTVEAANPKDYYVSTNGLHDVSGVTWGTYRTDDGVDHDAYTNLQQVIDVATGKDTIWIEDGFVCDEGFSGADEGNSRIKLGYDKGGLVMRSRSGDWRTGAEIRGRRHSAEVACGENAIRCVYSGGNGVKLIGLRLVGGCTGTGNKNNAGGGLLSSQNYRPRLENCLIADCTAAASGGGAYFPEWMKNCVLTNNTALKGVGGGVNTVKWATGCEFRGNVATGTGWQDGCGGGIGTQKNLPCSLTNCVFIGNHAVNTNCWNLGTSENGRGGGYYGGTYNQGNLVGCVFSNCSATACGGAVCYAYGGTNVTVGCCVAGRDGGGIFYGTWNDGVIADCIISNDVSSNTSRNGGGVADLVRGENLTISGCRALKCGGGASSSVLVKCNVFGNTVSNTVSGCSGDGRGVGGGVYGGKAWNCRIVDNRAYGSGGGAGGGTVFYNTLIARNEADTLGAIYPRVVAYLQTKEFALVNCTVTANTNRGSGASITASKAIMTNSIVWANSVASGAVEVTPLSAVNSCWPTATEGTDGNTAKNPRLGTVDGKEYAAQSYRCKARGATHDWMTDATDPRSKDWYGDLRIQTDAPDLGWVSLTKTGLTVLVR